MLEVNLVVKILVRNLNVLNFVVKLLVTKYESIFRHATTHLIERKISVARKDELYVKLLQDSYIQGIINKQLKTWLKHKSIINIAVCYSHDSVKRFENIQRQT
jgi:hypothetical protein